MVFQNSLALSQETLIVGKILKPFGLKGGLKVESYTQQPESLFAFSPLIDVQGCVYKVSSFHQRGHGPFFNVFFQDVCSIESAELFRDKELLIYKNQLAPLEDDTFYYADLMGLDLFDEDLQIIVGQVVFIHEFGAGDVLEIQPVDTKETWFLHMKSSSISKIDLQVKKIFYRSSQL